MARSLDPTCLEGFNVTWGNIFERSLCLARITEFLNSSNVTTSPACMRELFVDGLNTNRENPFLTLQGCQAFCGKDWGYYPDSASRVVDWVVPIVVLVSNINLSPVERRVMMGIIHALGDPIDTLWSLLDKLYAWYICNQVARRAVEAAQLAGGPRLDPSNQGNVNNAVSAAQDEERDRDNIKSVQFRINPVDLESRDSLSALPSSERIRIIATVLGGFEELAGHLMTCPRKFYTTTITMLGNPAAEYISCSASSPPISSPHAHSTSLALSSTISPNPSKMISNPAISQWHSTALCLVDDRTNEFLRTGMAVLLYFFQVISEFVDQISQNSENTPGGRIGAAMMLSYLIPVALLSNLLGGFPSRRSNLRPLLDLLHETLPTRHHKPATTSTVGLPDHDRREPLNPHQNPTPVVGTHESADWNAYFFSQRQTGSIYGFRPSKTNLISHSTSRRDKLIRLSLPLIASFPILSSFAASFILHWEAVPSGFSCRHVWIITVFGLWILSPFLTFFFSKIRLNPRGNDKNNHISSVGFWLIYTKDFLIGMGTISMIIASVIGVFNSCFCWSLAMWLGEENAIMAVNTRGTYLQRKRGMYPALVGGFILLELVFVAAVVWLLWSGLGVMRWGEENKRRGWDRLRKGDLRVLYGFLNGVAASKGGV